MTIRCNILYMDDLRTSLCGTDLCLLLGYCGRLRNPCDETVKQAAEIILIDHWEAALSSHMSCRLSNSVVPSLEKNQAFVQLVLATNTDAY